MTTREFENDRSGDEYGVDDGTAAGTAAGADEENLLATFRLHHERWNPWLYYVLPAAAVLQWVLVVPLAVREQVLTSDSPGFDPLRTELAAGVEPTGFFNDYFFTVWNLFPLVLFVVYLVANRFGRRWIRDVAPRIDTSEAAPSIRRLRRIRDHWVPAVLVVVAGVAGSAAQIPKQLGFFETHSQLYWWDWRVSPSIFTIRDVALFFNVILVVLVFWGTLFGLLIVIEAVRKGSVNPDYFHPDGAGGMLPLGNAMSVLILPWVAGAFLGVLGFFDHTTASELLFRIGDVALIATCTLIATLLFAYPLYLTKEKVVTDLDRVRENIHNLADQHELAQKLANEDPEQLDEIDPTEHGLTDSAGVILVYQRLDSINGWPIDNQRVYQVALLVASPGITVLTRSINTFINTYWF
jgi:hypothetical protein